MIQIPNNLFKRPATWLVLLSGGIAFVYILTMLDAAAGRSVAPLDDAYIHFQYARQMALGQPWQYNTGDPISTGTTSLLYPFLLAAAFRLGFTGDAIVWPALLLGSASLVLSTILIYRITYLLSDDRVGDSNTALRQGIALATALLFLLTGAIPWAYLNGMETGLFTLMILGALHGFVSKQTRQFAAFLVLASLLRPEGLFLTAVAWLIVFGQFLLAKPAAIRQLKIVTLALAFSTIPYFVNIVLTGTPAATGAQAKSWLGNVPFVPTELLYNMGRMLYFILERMALGFLAGKPWPAVPAILILALFGSWVLWQHKDRWTVFLVWGWFLAGALATATLITALWQTGRYQVPYYALLLPFVGVGLAYMLERSSAGWRKVIAGAIVILFGLAIISSVQAWRAYSDAVASIKGQQIALAEWIKDRTPTGAVVAVHDAGAIRYVGERPIYDLIGLTTQGVAGAWRHGSGAIFELMEQSSPRPAYFATYPDVATIPYLVETDLFAGELFRTIPLPTTAAGVAGPLQVIYDADWRPSADSDLPLQEDVKALIAGLDLVSTIDLADLGDEKEKGVSWTVGRTQPGFPTEARQFGYRTDPQRELLDGGRLISGSLSFPLQVTPGVPVLLAARLHAPQDGVVSVTVNGVDAGLWRYPAAPGQWLESTFLIPGELIAYPEANIELRFVDPDGQAQPFQVYHLWAYQGQPQRAPMKPGNELGHRFGNDILLEGYDLETNTIKAGGELPLTLYWRSAGPPDLDAKIFLHLYDGQGELVAQIDQRPYHDTRPPYTWLPDMQVNDPITLTIPDHLSPGDYELALGLYEAQSGERLLITTADGAAVSDGRLWLAEITVEE